MRTSASVALFTLVVASCSRTVTSVPEDRPIASLTPAEKSQLCTDTARYLVDNLEGAARDNYACGIGATIAFSFASLFQRNALAECRASYESCRASPQKEPERADGGDVQDGNCELVACDGVRVGDFTACVRETEAQLQRATFDCELVRVSRDGGLPESTGFGMVPAACRQLAQKCAAPR